MTQLSQLKQFMKEGNHRAALKLAAGWSRLGEHKKQIQQGWSALQNPKFYKEIGKDPDKLVECGIQSIRERYKIGE